MNRIGEIVRKPTDVKQKKPVLTHRFLLCFAEAEGFEPPVPCGTPVFKTGAIDQLCQTSVDDANLRQRKSNSFVKF